MGMDPNALIVCDLRFSDGESTDNIVKVRDIARGIAKERFFEDLDDDGESASFSFETETNSFHVYAADTDIAQEFGVFSRAKGGGVLIASIVASWDRMTTRDTVSAVYAELELIGGIMSGKLGCEYAVGLCANYW